MLRYRISPTGARYAFLGQEAQKGIVGYGRTMEEAFEGAAAAMFALITELSTVQPLRTIPLSFIERDVKRALVRWLDLLLKCAREEKLIFSEFSIDHQGALWRCCATGQPWPDIEPGIADKITLAKVGSVKRIASVWEARCVMRRQRFSRDWSSCNHAVPVGACRTH